jgi:membrane-associated phospholipid phosphatase
VTVPTGGSRRAGILAGARSRRLVRLLGLVLAAFVLVEVLLLGLGVLITRVLDGTGLHEEEQDAARAILRSRTPWWNDVTAFGTVAGATVTVVLLTAAGCLLLLHRGQGPRLPTFLAVAVAGQTVLFLLAAAVIDRERPDIPQLDVAPPTSSFPSGHTAATVALGFGLALGLARTHPRHRLRAVIWVLAGAYAGFVTFSRLYRGMHWPTDVAASVVYTLIWLYLLRTILLPRGVADAPRSRSGTREGPGGSSTVTR